MNSKNRDIIIILCSYLCMGEDIKPFTIKEWSIISERLIKNKKEPSDLLFFNDDDFYNILNFSHDDIVRIKRLFNRSASLAFEIEQLSNKGIHIVTRADNDYPILLKQKLGYKCPPLFYYSGNLNLLNKKFIGIVGSRNINESDINYTQKIVLSFLQKGYSIISGGAKGIDRTSTEYVLKNDGDAIEILSDSLVRRIKDNEIIKAIKNDKLLLLSATVPTAGFDVGTAMQRNKYIYCISDTTIVIKSDYNKGGTWNGAKEAILNQYTNVCCWNNCDYFGNQKLIELGANVIDEELNILNSNNNKSKLIQTSIFDYE